MKGWFENAQLLMDDGRSFPLSFWDPTRLGQELEAHFARGEQFFAERNLIILPSVTEEAIRQTVLELIAKGFF
jgi:hypothetical protein